MAVYLKKFDTHSEYETYINGSGAILPNVSICEDTKDAHYNPYVEQPETRLVAKFNVTSTSSPTPISYKSQYVDGTSGFSAIEIDGVEQPSVVSAYTFSTTGEHTVKYTLADPTSIVKYAFRSCSSLASIEIPNSVISIGNEAFGNCSGLTSVTIPNSVTSISFGAFRFCSSLTSVTIPDSVTSIGNGIFSNCKGLISIIIPNSVTSIGTGICDTCSSLTSITIPDSVTSIGDRDFYGCTSLISIDIPSGVTSIGSEAFSNCSGLTSVTIPDSVTSIGGSAFYSCSGLTSCIIGSGVTSIGGSAFYSCSGLTSIKCNATTAPTINSFTFKDIKTGGTLTVPSGSSGYDVWMGTGDYYLGKYNWTKVEQ